MEQIALYLRVNLPEDVRSFTHVEGAPNANCDDLGRDLKLVEELLVLAVILLKTKYHHYDLRMPEDCLWPSHHVVHKLSFYLNYILLIVKLYEVRLPHSDLQHIACLLEGLKDPVSDLVV